MHRICLCPASIAWIRKHLVKSARSEFTRLISRGTIRKLARPFAKPHRSAKQKAATRKLIIFNKTHNKVRRRRRR